MKFAGLFLHDTLLCISEDGTIIYDPCSSRILRQTTRHDGYRTVTIGGKTIHTHRLVAAAWLEPEGDADVVNHIDGVKSNNHYTNLEWCTHQENMQHAHDTGLCLRKGQHNSRATLTESIVHEICQWFQDNPTLGAKAATEIFNVPFGILSKIRSGQTWQHIRSLYKILPLTGRAKFND